jgi:hypothetical protein
MFILPFDASRDAPVPGVKIALFECMIHGVAEYKSS